MVQPARTGTRPQEGRRRPPVVRDHPPLNSMSAVIMRQRNHYYRALELTRSGSMNITAWMLWFFDCLTEAIDES